MSVLLRLLRDDSGQDLREYALLTAGAGFAGAVAFQAIAANINFVYSSWDTGVNAIWEVPPPQ